MTMQNRAPIEGRADLSMAYTPGVARVCMAIHHDPDMLRILLASARNRDRYDPGQHTRVDVEVRPC